MEAKYNIFTIERYECAWTMDNAVVAAESPVDASDLLKTYLEIKTHL